MQLSQLICEIPHNKLNFEDTEVKTLCADSRVSGEGDLFFCLSGTKVDSHVCAREAEKRGVCAVVGERDCGVKIPQIILSDGREGMAKIAASFYGNPQKRLKIVGITGTNGKTTTAHILYRILLAAGKRVGLIGTLGAKYAGRVVDPDLTTPDPIALFSLLKNMVDAGVEYVVMEVSAHALYFKKTCPILFERAIFTNLSHDHLDFFGDMEGYGEAKKLLFSPSYAKFALLNADDAFSERLTGTEGLSYALRSPADCFAIVEEESVRGSKLMLNLCDGLVECTVNMTGKHNVYNALAAASCAYSLGVSCSAISEGISSCKSVDGRLEHVASYQGAEVFVDFAHTPDGLEKSLAALRPFCTGRLIVLFGCGGNRDDEKRPVMGETAAKGSDFAVITSDNPRYEDACAIIARIEEGYRKVSRKYVAIESREKATEYALKLLKRGDILLVAGKGGETYQEIMGIKYGYNDKAVINRLLGE